MSEDEAAALLAEEVAVALAKATRALEFWPKKAKKSVYLTSMSPAAYVT